MKMKDVNVGVVGLGNVGSGTISILAGNAVQISQKLGFHLRVAALQGGADAERLTKHDLESLAGKIGADECRKQASAVNSWHQSHPIAFVFVYKAGAAKGAFPATAVAYASDGSIAGQLIPLSSS